MSRLARSACVAGLGLSLFLVALVGQETAPAGAALLAAAQEFLVTLTPEQKKKVVFAYDHAERTRWDFVPLQDKDRQPTRQGLSLATMSEPQSSAARKLLRSGLSDAGYQAAVNIMSLESLLHEQEGGRGNVRDPKWYFWTLYGQPGPTESWGFRVEGHHLSVSFSLQGQTILAAAPAFFGANPSTVKAGPRAGLRAIGEVEDLAKELVASFSDGERARAQQTQAFPEIKARTKSAAAGTALGIQHAQMTASQRQMTDKLIAAYLARLAPAIAANEWARRKAAGVDQLTFAFSGDTTPGTPWTYRLQGPTFRVEFLNVQADASRNPANHIHSVWRSLPNDFGL